MRRLAGVVSITVDEYEERGLPWIPGTQTGPCYRCSRKLVLTPALLKLRYERQTEPWCWECVAETNPKGVHLGMTKEILLEYFLAQRLMEQGGPVH